MRVRALSTLMLLTILVLPFTAADAAPKRSPEVLAKIAVGEDAAAAVEAASELRTLGPEGLDAMMRLNADAIERHRAGTKQPDEAAWSRVSNALDRVARQRDAWASGLYWYTDLEQAKAASKASGKPIISLRLLGYLDDEFSCANSRFFRTLVYPDRNVSQSLRENFILHWQSVRPVPRVTIDFGNGRTLERTLTGNSVHYALSPEGELLDALPGMQSPDAFLRWVWEASAIFEQTARLDPAKRWQALRAYHKGRMFKARQAWANDMQRVGLTPPKGVDAKSAPGASDPYPDAIVAGRVAYTKAMVELPVLRAFYPEEEPLAAATDDAAWRKIASLHLNQVTIDPSAHTVICKFVDQGSVAKTVENLREALAFDTTRNEYVLHASIHEWLSKAPSAPTLDAFTSRVYGELFLTPSDDPWLGLNPDDVFTGLGGRKGITREENR